MLEIASRNGNEYKLDCYKNNFTEIDEISVYECNNKMY